MQEKQRRQQDAAREKPCRAEDIHLSELSSYRLSRHSKLMRRGRDAEAERLGVTIDEWRLLFVLHRMGPQPSIRLAEAALMDRGTVSRAVSQLERRGLLFRLSDASDGRVSIVNLTDPGAKVADQITRFMLSREMAMIERLTDEEWQAWLTVTDKFHDFLNSEYGGDD